jgi:MFS transporter, DHA1 family, multidrug resistance protein
MAKPAATGAGRSDWRRILYIMFVAQLFSATGFSVTFPFMPLYVKHLGTFTSISLDFWAGAAFSAQAFTMMLAAPFWGALADRYGRKLMVARAMFGGTIMLALMAFVRSAEELVLLRTIQGFLTGTDSAANALVASTAPREKAGFAMGLLQVSLWGGIALGPLIGGFLAEAFGYAMPFLVTAAMLFIAGVLVWFGINENFEPSTHLTDNRVSFVAEWRHVLSMPGVVLTYTLRFLNALSRSMIIPILPLFVATLVLNGEGVSSMTGLIVGIPSAAATATAIYFGRLGDRIGHRRIVIACAFAAALCYIPQSFVSEPGQLLLLQIFTGAATGGLISCPSALLARYTDPGEEGAVYGLDNSIVSGARAVAPLIGASIALWLGYRGVFLLTGVILLLMVFLAVRWLPDTASSRVMMSKRELKTT